MHKSLKHRQELRTELVSSEQNYFSTYTIPLFQKEPFNYWEQQIQNQSYIVNNSWESSNTTTFKIIENLDEVPSFALVQTTTLKILENLPIEGQIIQPATSSEDKLFPGFRILENIHSNHLSSTLSGVENNHSFFISNFFKKNYHMELEATDNAELYAFISRWHRVPYRWGGNSMKGIDCSGLVGVIADSLFQIKIPRDAGNIFKVCTPLPKDSLQEGDLVFFIQGSYIFHVGMYLKNNKFVHASSGLGVIISDLNEPYYKRFFFCGGRLKKS
ncbi:MAG: C40 family peptidase [Bacteroidia bacterium]|nr:C40 family peptidase [Bacteroidia bacterium]MDW8159754.1 C40 family peptidase [Bacteroidia bacterium]